MSVEDAAFGNYYQNSGNIPEVTGKIIHMPAGSHKKAKIKYAIVTPSREIHENKVANVSKDGTFKLKLDHAVPYQQIWLTMGPYYGVLYIKDGLHIQLDLDKTSNKKLRFYHDAVTFTGSDAALTTFMNKHITFKREKQLELSSALQKLSRNRELDYPVYKSKYDSIYQIIKDIDMDFMTENPSDYKWFIDNERKSGYYKDLLVKNRGKKMDDTLWKDIKNHKVYAVSNDGMLFYRYLYDYLSIDNSSITLNLNDLYELKGLSKAEKEAIKKSKEIAGKSKAGKQFDSIEDNRVGNIVSALFQDLFEKRNNDRNGIVVKIIDSCFAQPKADMLKLKMKGSNPEQQKIIDAIVLESLKTPWVKAEVERMAEENQANLDEIQATLKNASVSNTTASAFGNPMMEFDFGAKLFEVKDMTSQELLTKIKSSFKDKALMLDFWAVWCGPCLGDFPSSKKLYDAVENEPVEFVYLCTSTGGSIEQWKSKIAAFKLGGTHLFVEETVEAELMKLFNGLGFPTYAFINKKGEYKPGSIDRMASTSKNQLVKLIHGEQ